MGMLDVVKLHNALEDSAAVFDYSVFECELQSWGELCDQAKFFNFPGSPNEAREILSKFPFRLLSVTPVQKEASPQKLCLVFRAPYEHRSYGERVSSGGYFPIEVLTEFTAFLALLTRRRIFAQRLTRQDNRPVDLSIIDHELAPFQERQRLKLVNPDHVYRLMDTLLNMEDRPANSFLLSARLYHTATRLMYTEPEFAYVFLISALEAISSGVYEEFVPEDVNDYLNDAYPGWSKPLSSLGKTQLEKVKGLLIKHEHFAFRKLRSFVEEFIPNRFWTEDADDAKPLRWITSVTVGASNGVQERMLQSDSSLLPWEKLERADLRKALRAAYDCRSALMHKGERYPASIVLGLTGNEIAIEAAMEMVISKTKGAKLWTEVPPLLTFERLVSYTLVEFLEKQST